MRPATPNGKLLWTNARPRPIGLDVLNRAASGAIFGLLFLACTVACTHDTTPVHEHAPALTTPAPAVRVSGAETDFSTVDLVAIEKSLQAGDDPLHAAVEPLAPYFLNRDFLLNPKFAQTEKAFTGLGIFNQGLKLALVLHPTEAASYLKTYGDLLNSGCTAGKLQGCDFLSFFAKDPAAVFLVKRFAENTPEVRARFRWIQMGFELSPLRGDPELKSLIADHFMELLKSYVHISIRADGSLDLSLAQLGLNERRELKTHCELITLALEDANSDRPALAAAARELFLWLQSGQIGGIFDSKLNQAFTELVAKHIHQPEVWRQYASALNARERNNPESYSTLRAGLLKTHPQIIENLQFRSYDLAQPNLSQNTRLYFDVIDSAFRQVPRGQIMPYWNASDREVLPVLDMMEDYLRLMLIDRGQRTTRGLAKFFNDFKTQGNSRSELLNRALREGQADNAPMWMDYFKSVYAVRAFFQDELESRYENSDDPKIRARIAETRRFFNQINRNVKITVTYPNLLMLAYYASIFEYRETIDTFMGQFTLDGHAIMMELINGRLPPLFVFTNYEEDDKALDEVEIMYAMDFAVETGLFATYGVNGAAWFSELYKSYLQADVEKLRDWTTRLQREGEGGTEDSPYHQLKRICEFLQNGPRPENPTLNIKSNLERLRRIAFLGELDPHAPSPLAENIKLIVPNTGNRGDGLQEALEVIRSDVDPKLRRLILIQEMLKKTGDTAALAAIEQALAETKRMRDYVFNTVRAFVETMHPCFLKLSGIERSRKKQLLQMELRHMEHVGLALSALQQFQGVANEVPVAQLRAQPHPIWSEPFFSGLHPELPLLPALNRLFSESLHLDRAFAANPEYKSNYEMNGSFQLDAGGSNYVYHYRMVDLMMRTASYLQFGYAGLNLDYRPEILTFDYPTSLRELEIQLMMTYDKRESFKSYFLRFPTQVANIAEGVALFKQEAAKKLLKVQSNSESWLFDISETTDSFRRMVQTSTALYKLGFERDLSLAHEVDCDQTCHQKRFEQMKASARGILQESWSILDFVNLKPEDQELLRFLGHNSYYEDTDTEYTILAAPNYLFVDGDYLNSYYGFADEAYVDVVSFTLGVKPLHRGFRSVDLPPQETGGLMDNPSHHKIEMFPRQNPSGRVENFYATLRDPTRLLLFPTDERVAKLIHSTFTFIPKREAELERAFVESFAEFKAQTSPRAVQFSLLRDPLENPIFLSFKEQYDYVNKKFNQDTESVFQ